MFTPADPNRQLCWGILGPGAIARSFATGLAQSRSGTLVAVGSRDHGRAAAFADEQAAAGKGQQVRAHGSYEALLADAEVDVVYVATPHTEHARWAIAAAEAGKHLLIEKPMAPSLAIAETVFAAAEHADVFCMEALMYRCHPQTAKLHEVVADGAIGRVVSVETVFSFRSDHDPSSRLYDPERAGGGILDVGGYPVSMARLVAGAAQTQREGGEARWFAEPVGVVGGGHLTPEGVDDWAVASLQFEGGMNAHVATGMGLGMEHICRVYGTGGFIDVPNPWNPCHEWSPAGLVLHRTHRDDEQIAVDTPQLYAAEVDHVAAYVDQRQAPAMSWDDTRGNLAVLDQWRERVGVRYPFE
ncbi:Gfo/Idh/MocA family protein [Aestuariimicrobium ganziense]|uniref:Gfo/Idh/MocA family protein n=1 Tax=Aestuariimicrobium ganziense TaxID=2773677 RepID=UPI0019422B67|nr:Gfo/Idh/MocA family oxidoreductase [Aestuariimicrobium ganziense]